MTRARRHQPGAGEVVVVMIGASHNAQDGDERVVSAEVAQSLVDRGLARLAIDSE